MTIGNKEKRRILDVVDSKKADTIEFLRTLIKTKSYTGEEGQAQEVVRKRFEAMGLELDVFEPDSEELKRHPAYVPIESSEKMGYKNRPNVVGKKKGRGAGRSIILYTHIDTVPVGPLDQWTHDPFSGEIAERKMYGRGTADNKSGITMMTIALESILDAGVKLQGDIALASVIEEEAGGSGGSLALIQRGYRADAAIYPHAEQAGLAIVAAQGGGLSFRIRVTGKMTHSHSAHLGINAIGKMFKIYQSLMDFDQHRRLTVRHVLFENYFRHADLPCSTTNLVPAIIKGGEWAYQVPNECELICSIGFPPTEEMENVKTSIESLVKKTAEADSWLRDHPPKVEWFGWKCEPSETNANHPIVTTAQQYLEEITGTRPPLIGTPGFGDMRWMVKYANTPTIQFGPKGGALHGSDEWVDIDDLLTAIKVVALTIMDFSGYDV